MPWDDEFEVSAGVSVLALQEARYYLWGASFDEVAYDGWSVPNGTGYVTKKVTPAGSFMCGFVYGGSKIVSQPV